MSAGAGGEAPPINAAYVPRPSVGTHAIQVDDGVLLLNERSQALIRLDRIGALVYECFDGMATVQEIAADIAPAFGTPLHVVTADIARLAHDLVGTTILVDSNPPMAAEHEVPAPPFMLINPPSP